MDRRRLLFYVGLMGRMVNVGVGLGAALSLVVGCGGDPAADDTDPGAFIDSAAIIRVDWSVHQSTPGFTERKGTIEDPHALSLLDNLLAAYARQAASPGPPCPGSKVTTLRWQRADGQPGEYATSNCDGHDELNHTVEAWLARWDD